jgi:hypothetical protein
VGYLARHFDADTEVAPDLTSEVIRGNQIGRLSRQLAVVLYASSIPRRLGGDADDDELKMDKKRGRRTAHALSQSLKAWAGRIPALTADDEIKRAGAQLDWDRWRQEHFVDLKSDMTAIATWGLRGGDERFAKTAIVRMENELSWISYALRE